MDIASFEEFASIDKEMIERDDTDSWLWREDPFKLDCESPLAISKSFWEDLTTNEEDSQSLFASTPPIVDRETSPSYFSLDSQVENGGRFKRRRMLQFSSGKDDCLAAESPPFESVSTIDSTFVSCVNPLISGGDEFLMPIPSSPSTLWYTKDEEGCKGADDKWMSKCLEHKEPHSPPEEVKDVVPNVQASAVPGKCMQSRQSTECEVLQGPLTPFSKGSTTAGWRSGPLTRFRVKASTPVAYPFALVKPSGAQGDVTLNDINQRILSPSPRPSRHQHPGNEERSPAHPGAGLSGKSVVACTKIHTEGNGTITIMRTRG